ncbi:MAG: hypothetical protein AAF518_02590 [Spirochaetota bacterium]
MKQILYIPLLVLCIFGYFAYKTPIHCCSCMGTKPDTALMLLSFVSPYNDTTSGSCHSEKLSYCWEFTGLTTDFVTLNCPINGGTAVAIESCTQDNAIARCRLKQNQRLLFYSNGGMPYTTASARSKCETELEGTFEEL